eukprot:2743988-Alexandrium_andersonii.AAC.1
MVTETEPTEPSTSLRAEIDSFARKPTAATGGLRAVGRRTLGECVGPLGPAPKASEGPLWR